MWRRELRRTGRIAGFVTLTSVMLPAFVARRGLAASDDRERVRERWVGAWCGALLRLFAVDAVSPSQTLALPAGRGHLVVANHRSTADILLLLRMFGGHMVSRADLARWPLVGAAARSVGTVFVDRSDAVSGANAVRAMRDLLAGGKTVIVFPEGTTFPDDDVRPFYGGAFAAAMRSGADVVPVGIAYASGCGAAFVNESFGAHLARMAAATPSRVALCRGAPIEIGTVERAGEVRDRAHAAVSRLVRQARGLVDRLP